MDTTGSSLTVGGITIARITATLIGITAEVIPCSVVMAIIMTSVTKRTRRVVAGITLPMRGEPSVTAGMSQRSSCSCRQ